LAEHSEGFHTCPKCEEGWELHGGKCYYFSTRDSSWYQSRDDCRRGGGDLSFLELRLKQNMNKDDDSFWIGLTDSKEEGKWLFDCCGKILTFWSGTQPNNHPYVPEGEDCVMMEMKRGADDLKCWHDVPCIISLKSICEKSV
uniref:C-type lectin domain-containing protein n=1 Tax=Anabas testudineus TaxID=64144 RepID=A0A3Q1H6I8_ANATE